MPAGRLNVGAAAREVADDVNLVSHTVENRDPIAHVHAGAAHDLDDRRKLVDDHLLERAVAVRIDALEVVDALEGPEIPTRQCRTATNCRRLLHHGDAGSGAGRDRRRGETRHPGADDEQVALEPVRCIRHRLAAHTGYARGRHADAARCRSATAAPTSSNFCTLPVGVVGNDTTSSNCWGSLNVATPRARR